MPSEGIGEEASPVLVLHITDLHFGAHDLGKTAAIRALAEETCPDMLCVTGDIVHWPYPSYFRQARGFLDELSAHCSNRWFIVPGNHDMYFPYISTSLYKRTFDREPEYGLSFKVNDRDVCVFGVDTTCFSLAELNTSGKFSHKSEIALVENIQRVEYDIGEAFERAIKIVLLHHHPLPTLSSEYEHMLYFKNSGKFLNIAAQHGINLVLHGHKHDPTYISVDYNTGLSSSPMIILSGGTATKSLENEETVSPTCQLHLVRLYPERTEVECYNYHTERRKFYRSRAIVNRSAISPIREIERNYKYIVMENGDMKVRWTRKLQAEGKRSIKTLPTDFGVEDDSPGCDFDKLNFVASQDGIQIPPHKYKCKLTDDLPHTKRVVLELNTPIEVKLSEITFEYVWPKGFENLLLNRTDKGYWGLRKMDRLTVNFEIENKKQKISKFDVYSLPSQKIEYLHMNDDYQRGFCIDKPIPTLVVWSYLWI